jgi:hypothetical protein
MGVLQRLAARQVAKNDAREWQSILPLCSPLEMAVFRANLRCRTARENLRGSLFLTSHRIVWRIREPGYPHGSGFESRLADLAAVGRPEGSTEPGVFMLGIVRNGAAGAVLFSPQMQTAANVQLAEEMFAQIAEFYRFRTETASPAAGDVDPGVVSSDDGDVVSHFRMASAEAAIQAANLLDELGYWARSGVDGSTGVLVVSHFPHHAEEVRRTVVTVDPAAVETPATNS